MAQFKPSEAMRIGMRFSRPLRNWFRKLGPVESKNRKKHYAACALGAAAIGEIAGRDGANTHLIDNIMRENGGANTIVKRTWPELWRRDDEAREKAAAFAKELGINPGDSVGDTVIYANDRARKTRGTIAKALEKIGF